MSSTSKVCFVPSCKNTSSNCRKIFITVPANVGVRKQWCVAVGRKFSKYHTYCCEDHFDMKEDAKNWFAYSFNTNGYLRLKDGIVPHRYIWEQNHCKLSQLSNCATEELPSKRVKTEQETPSSELNSSSNPGSSFTFPSKKKTNSVCVKLTNTETSVHGNKTSASEASMVLLGNVNLTTKQLLKNKLPIEHRSRFYLGLPHDIHQIIKILERNCSISRVHICIILKKIRLFQANIDLATDFNMSESNVSKILRTHTKNLAQFVKMFIYWPSSETIKKLLPMPFRSIYRNVQSVLSVLEVDIEKPSTTFPKALAWSHSKRTTTIKYLVSTTPDGLFNFVTAGYGGRTTENVMAKDSHYLEFLPANCDVMVNNYVDDLGILLQTKSCNLIRPFSASSPVNVVTGTRAKICGDKRKVHLKTCIDHAIHVLHEFAMLKADACIKHSLVWALDSAVVIVAGIINLQNNLNVRNMH